MTNNPHETSNPHETTNPHDPYTEGPAAYAAPGMPAQPPVTPQAPMTPQQERTWAMLSHAIPAVATVLSAGFLGFIASLVIYLAYRDRGPFVRQAAANSLNVQLTTLVVLVASAILWVPLLFVGVGFLIYGAIFAVAVVLHLIAALRANEGQWYKPPMTIGFVK